MFSLVKKHKIKSSIVILLVLFFIIIMPFILNKLYNLNAPCDLFNLEYDRSNILDYYGAILTFLGTVGLGSITVYQNYLSQKKTDEVNKLTLELQKKSMAMAEQNYEKEKQYETKKNSPKFELRILGYNGWYMNLQASLKNVSDSIVSGIKSISFDVCSESMVRLTGSNKVKSDKFSLTPGQETEIAFNNENLDTKLLSGGHQAFDSIKNLYLVWSFQCEDIYSNTHYYRAKLFVEDSNNLVPDLWDVQKVG